MTFYIDKLEPQFKEGGKPGEVEVGKVVRELLFEVRMSPQRFKSIADWMVEHLKRLEKQGVKFPKGEPSKTYVT